VTNPLVVDGSPKGHGAVEAGTADRAGGGSGPDPSATITALKGPVSRKSAKPTRRLRALGRRLPPDRTADATLFIISRPSRPLGTAYGQCVTSQDPLTRPRLAQLSTDSPQQSGVHFGCPPVSTARKSPGQRCHTLGAQCGQMAGRKGRVAVSDRLIIFSGYGHRSASPTMKLSEPVPTLSMTSTGNGCTYRTVSGKRRPERHGGPTRLAPTGVSG